MKIAFSEKLSESEEEDVNVFDKDGEVVVTISQIQGKSIVQLRIRKSGIMVVKEILSL